mgnify:CR=1 FL=1
MNIENLEEWKLLVLSWSMEISIHIMGQPISSIGAILNSLIFWSEWWLLVVYSFYSNLIIRVHFLFDYTLTIRINFYFVLRELTTFSQGALVFLYIREPMFLWLLPFWVSLIENFVDIVPLLNVSIKTSGVLNYER